MGLTRLFSNRRLVVVGGCLAGSALLSALPARSQEDDPLPPLESGPAAPRDWAAWTGVPRLLGESHAHVESTLEATDPGGMVTSSHEMANQWATVQMELEVEARPDDGANPRRRVWRVVEAHGFGGMAAVGRKSGPNLSEDISTRGTYVGAMSLRTRPALSLDLRSGQWSFMTLGEQLHPWTTSTQFSRVDWGRETRSTVTAPGGTLEDAWIQDVAPRRAVAFTGTFQLQESGPGRGDHSSRTLHRTARVLFWPDWPDVEVRIEVPGYEAWRPRGNLEHPDQPGPESIEVRATLRPPVAQPTPAQLAAIPAVRRFRFELMDTSREPGVCMNWPVFGPDAGAVPPEDPEYDLRFEPAPGAVLSPRRQKIGVPPMIEDGLPTARTRVACYDFGAHGSLRVVAELADGREVTGYMEASDGPRYLVGLPDRANGSLIARVWRDKEMVESGDEADIDDRPEGDGQMGDGFSVYEEYRGFAVAGRHRSLKPAEKDLFVLNRIGQSAREGLDLVSEKTGDDGGRGFRVHHRLLTAEMPASRAMNLNRSARAPRTATEPQHGLILVPFYLGLVSKADFDGKHEQVAWRPKNVLAVRVLDSLVTSDPRDHAATVAHEISHAIGVRHHGELDLGLVIWDLETERGQDGVTRKYFRETNSKGVETRVELFFEDRRRLDPNLPKAEELFGEPFIIYVASQHGQHSGNDTCWMRYDSAGAFVPAGQPTHRIVVRFPADKGPDDEPAGLEVCDDAAGTGVNDPQRARQPLPGGQPDVRPISARYGDAARGNCRSQFCVRDDAPDKGQAKKGAP